MEGSVIVLSYDNTYDDIIEDMEWAINKVISTKNT